MKGNELGKECRKERSKQKEHHTRCPGRRKELGLLMELKGSQQTWGTESQRRETEEVEGISEEYCAQADLTRALKTKPCFINF